MKAILCSGYGGPEVLHVGQVEKPTPKADEILVKIMSSAVTASDCVLRGLEVPGGHAFPVKQLMRLGMRFFIGFNKPKNPILGVVFSGVVEAAGKAVETIKPGDELFGFTGISRGGYAEYKCVSLKEIQSGEVGLKPENVSHAEAAALVYGGLLATHFMRNAHLKSWDKVLIYGASGAIGTIAIQMAKHFGTEVTAVCSARNFDLVTSLGADKLIDYTQPNAVDRLEEYDFILDAVGKNKTSALKAGCQDALKKEGKYASVDDGFMKIGPEYLAELTDLMEFGEFTAVIDKTFTMDQIVEAHRYVDLGHKKGNVILSIG